jgi:GT2 family glycosyltransferase
VTSPDVSVIVLNHNGRRWLSGCLDAVAAQAGAPTFETLLVDNRSTDGSPDFVRQEFPAVRVVELDTNLGFAAGNNAGARTARGRFLVFLNNDTIVAADWLARLVAAVDGSSPFAIATSRIVRLDDPSTVDSAGDGYLRAGGAYKHGHGRPADGYGVSREVFGACGAAFIVRRDVFDELGGFDESFFMVYEDVDLSYRARLRGYRCWYAADAVVRHAGSATLGRLSPDAVYYGQRNLEWTWIKNTPARLLWRTLPGHALYSVTGLAHYAKTGRLGPALRGKLAALAGLPTVLRSRRRTQSSARTAAEIDRLMDRDWVAIKRREKASGR